MCARGVPAALAQALAVPAAAQVACAPVVALLSGQVSLVAVPANLLVGTSGRTGNRARRAGDPGGRGVRPCRTGVRVAGRPARLVDRDGGTAGRRRARRRRGLAVLRVGCARAGRPADVGRAARAPSRAPAAGAGRLRRGGAGRRRGSGRRARLATCRDGWWSPATSVRATRWCSTRAAPVSWSWTPARTRAWSTGACASSASSGLPSSYSPICTPTTSRGCRACCAARAVGGVQIGPYDEPAAELARVTRWARQAVGSAHAGGHRRAGAGRVAALAGGVAAADHRGGGVDAQQREPRSAGRGRRRADAADRRRRAGRPARPAGALARARGRRAEGRSPRFGLPGAGVARGRPPAGRAGVGRRGQRLRPSRRRPPSPHLLRAGAVVGRTDRDGTLAVVGPAARLRLVTSGG